MLARTILWLWVLACLPLLNTSTPAADVMLARPSARLPLGPPTLGSVAHTQFCLRYSEECQIQNVKSRLPTSFASSALRVQMKEVNDRVNGSIIPRANDGSRLGTKWALNPETGDCKDYAASKRHELLRRGWPSHAVLLAEVATSSGEHHLILIVRVREGDFVLDNLSSDILPWFEPAYVWLRVQSPSDPRYWRAVARP